MSFDSPDEMIDRVNRQVAEAQERAVRATEMRQSVEAVQGRAASPRGEVSLAVDASGRLLSIDLSRDAATLSPDDLAQLILRTSHAAHRSAAAQVVGLAAEAFGEESDFTVRVREEVEGTLPPEDDGEAADPPASIQYR